MLEERILCAAILYDDKIKHPHQPKNIETGIVICGRRHNNCYTILAGLLGNIEGKKSVGREGQGFITSLDRFVSRSEAFKIAKKQNQIYHECYKDDDEGVLISEDLY
jgi:hypothetical protein